MQELEAQGGECWRDFHRARRAILVVDLVESVRLMQADEEAIVARWRDIVGLTRTALLPRYQGRLVKSLGDGMLLEFESVRLTLGFGRDLLRCLADLNGRHSNAEPLHLRVGMHIANIIIDDLDIYGAAVNLTSRIAGLANEDEILATIDAVDELVVGLDAEVEDLGDRFLKHLEEPVRVFRLHPPRSTTEPLTDDAGEPKSGREMLDELSRPRLATLTLEGAPELFALRSMLSDELAVQLSAHRTLDVVSRMSTRHAMDLEPAQLLSKLHTDYGLCGSCMTISDTVVLTLELFQTRGHRVVWSCALRRTIATLVANPEGSIGPVCQEIMAAIEVNETGRARSTPLASLTSYSLLTGGIRLMHRLSKPDFERSHEIFEALAARHPRHAEAYAWLAMWHILRLHQGWAKEQHSCLGAAHDMARRALDRDDRCGVAMLVSGMVSVFAHRDLAGAEAAYGSVLDHNPNDALGWLLKSTVHAFRGEGEVAVNHARRASSLSPLDPMRYYFDSLGASAFAAAGHFDDAIKLARRSLAANSMHASTLRILAISYAMLDRIDDARRTIGALLTIEPLFTVSRFMERSPSADYPIGRQFADALSRAGLPA